VSLEALILAKSREVATAQGQAIEAYIRVFIEQTGLRIDQVELVERRDVEADATTFTWYVRQRT